VIWDVDRLRTQLALGEDSRVEFKEAVFEGSRVRGPRRERVANELAALGNTLDAALVDRFISSRTNQADETQLTKLGLIREDDSGVLRATVAGVLLCTELPREHISGAAVEAVRYSGTVLGRAIQLDAATIAGPLDEQIRDAVSLIRGDVSVTARGRPLAGATVLALYPNKTWMREETDTLGRARFDFHSELPITVYCAAPEQRARVVRGWRPPDGLEIDLEAFPDGGSLVIPQRTGHLPGLEGRLNPILDSRDRMYLYATNVSINEGRPQPVHFKLGESLRLTDVRGEEWSVRFVEMTGSSSVLEYEPPPSRPR